MEIITKFKKTKVLFVAICILMILPSLPTFIVNSNKESNIIKQEPHTSALTEILRPMADSGNNQWLYYPLPHWSRLNEAVINPNPGDTTGIYAGAVQGHDNKIEEFLMTDTTLGPNKVLKIEVHTYGKSFGNTNPKVRIFWGGSWTARQVVNLPRSSEPIPPLNPGWATNTWELEGSETDVNNIRVEYLSDCHGYIFIPPYFSINIGNNHIYTSYCEITYKEVSPINPFDINSPEDMIYTSPPTEGYYPASYGFENDLNGAYGTGISFLHEWTGNMGSFLRMYVLDGPYGGHKKVLRISDSQGSGITTGVHNFDNPQSSGTIEFWLRMDGAAEVGSTDRYHQIEFRKSDDTIAFRAQLKMLEGGWVSGDRADVAYYKGPDWSDWEEFADCEDETWYHHSITFDCSGDGKFTWRVIAEDGSLAGIISDIPFENSMATLDEIYFTSIQSHYRGATYWDAFGFDWEPDYYVGDNQREGILLSYDYDPSIPLDWVGLILDDNPIQTLTGDTVLPLYDGGDHVLQLKGEDPDYIYFSDEIHYSCEPEGWHPKTLIGSSSVDIQGQIKDRVFPNNPIARLGFELQSTFVFRQDPILSFSITQLNGSEPEALGIKVYLNEQLVFDEIPLSFGIPCIGEVTLPELRIEKGHRIIIEIEDYGVDDQFKLDYVKISKLEWWDIKEFTIGEDTNPYTAYQIWGYDTEFDGLFVSLQTKHGSLDSSGWISASNPGFDTSIVLHINPDIDYYDTDYGPGFFVEETHTYYIEDVSIQISITRPDGSTLNWPEIVTFDFHLCKGAYDYNSMNIAPMDLLIDLVSLFFAIGDIGDDMYDAIFEYGDDIWLALGIADDTFGLLSDGTLPPKVYEDPLDSYSYKGGWKTGRVGTPPMVGPDPELDEFSMLNGWEPDLGGEPLGPYQIKITWNVEIWNHIVISANGIPSIYAEPLFTKSSTSYINFILSQV